MAGQITVIFVQRDLLGATATGLLAVNAINRPLPSPGTHFTLRFLCSGCITAAYAAGVPLERILRVRKRVSTTVVLRHCLDPLVAPTAAARVFFARFLPVARVFPVPAAPVSFYVGISLARAP
jgi:hypothetical protein